jgi:hypothetical protein
MEVVRVIRDSGDGRAPITRHFHEVTSGLEPFRQHIEHSEIIVGTKDAEWLRIDHLVAISVSLPWRFILRHNGSPAKISGAEQGVWSRTTNEIKAVRRETKTTRRVLQ